MNFLNLTIIWIALPFFLGFSIYLIPKYHKFLTLMGIVVSAGYALFLFFQKSPQTLQLLNNFGVTLTIDTLSAYFILTNALVSAAVLFYCWRTNKTAFFYAQMLILHGSVNATFVSTDLISVYVALEVSGIAAFLLIAYPRSDRSIWVALRYLFISNTAMLFYLVGAVLVYKAHQSFEFVGLKDAPPEAIALILLGLLVKAGVFVSGFWLPLTHSESETPVSAMLSGVVVKAGIYPLLRCALIVEELDPVIRILGVGTASLGVFYAIFEQDTKRTLALSTISQLGWILAAPAMGGFYALTHGLAKSTLFLTAGTLPSRNFEELQQSKIAPKVWLVLVIASLSISGFPLLSGFAAKVSTMNNLLPWQDIIMNVAVIGTVIVYAKFIFLPFAKGQNNLGILIETPVNLIETPVTQQQLLKNTPSSGFWVSVVFLIIGLIATNGFYPQAYTIAKLVKAIATICLGWLGYLLILQRVKLKLPRVIEQFEHLIGGMSLMLILIFWMVWT